MSDPEKQLPEEAAAPVKAGNPEGCLAKLGYSIVVLFVLLFAASIAIPKLAELFREPTAVHSGGNLDTIRMMLKLYYDDTGGSYPSKLESLAVSGKYLSSIPYAKGLRYQRHHEDSSAVHYGPEPDDTGGWWYNNISSDPGYGTVRVNCTHTDAKGKVWASY